MRDIDPVTGLAESTFGLARLQDGERVFHALVGPGGDIVDLSSDFLIRIPSTAGGHVRSSIR
jgi:hypothetical protein